MQFHVFGTSKHGRKIAIELFVLLYLSVHWGDFIEQITKPVAQKGGSKQFPAHFKKQILLGYYSTPSVDATIANRGIKNAKLFGQRVIIFATL